jgi:hypothetical protein
MAFPSYRPASCPDRPLAGLTGARTAATFPNARGLTPMSMQGATMIRALAGPAALGAAQFNPPRKASAA